jgi:hypothetical protein
MVGLRGLKFRVVTVPDLHYHDAEPPTSTVLEVVVWGEFDGTLPKYESLFGTVLADQYVASVVEGRHITTHALGADGEWETVVGFIQSLPVAEWAREGGKLAARAAATEVIRRLVARLADAGVRPHRLPNSASPPRLDAPPPSMEAAQVSAQNYLWSLRGGEQLPDELIDGKREDDGTFSFLYRLRDNGRRVRLAVLASGVVARYTLEEEAVEAERRADA